MFGFSAPEFVQVFLGCALGVALSIGIPILRKALGLGGTGGSLREAGGFWAVVRPYMIFAVLSLAIALVIVINQQFEDWRAAFLAGYVFDATIQKITGKP